MSRQPLLWAMAATLVLAAGCAENPVRVYQTMRSPTHAMELADVVVEGVVARSEDVASYPAGDISSNVFGKLGQECVVRTQVTFNVERVIKTPDHMSITKAPLVFFFNAACFHAEPDVMLGISLSPVLVVGGRLRAYLQDRGGEYWLISHERLPGSLDVPPSR